MRLAVELYGCVVGELSGRADQFDFESTPEGESRFGVNSTALSVAIPLQRRMRRDHAKRRRNWFRELLPEGVQYQQMLAQGGLRRGDTLAFLARYGRDIAGALQIWDVADSTEPKTPGLKPLTPLQLRQLLLDPEKFPLGNLPEYGKSSLGGVQPKIVLTQTKQGWAQAVGGFPTTHIFKPQLPGEQSTIIFDEEYGQRLAGQLGLASHKVWVENFFELNALVIQRFDREGDERVHQEDFSQILGARGEEKYQEFGGKVSLRNVAQILIKHVSSLDLVRFARMVILNTAIGNLDMHTKNVGLLHPEDGDIKLAPAYDVVPQAHGNNDGRFALSVNGIYRYEALTKADLVAELNSWPVRNASAIVEQTLAELMTVAETEVPLLGAATRLQPTIQRFVSNLQAGKPMGLAIS